MEAEGCQQHCRKYEHIEKSNFQNGAEYGVTGGTIGIVLHPVSHSDDCGNEVNKEQDFTGAVGFSGKTHNVQERFAKRKDEKLRKCNKAAAQIDKPLGTLKRFSRFATADARSDENGGGVGETGEETDDKSLNSTEYGNGRYDFGRLTTERDIDNHKSDADKKFVTDYRKALTQVSGYRFAAPAKMSGNVEEKRKSPHCGQQQSNAYVYRACANRGKCGAADTHRGSAELSVYEYPVQEDIGQHRKTGSNKRDSHVLGRAEQNAHSHGKYLKKIGKTDNPQILDTDDLKL